MTRSTSSNSTYYEDWKSFLFSCTPTSKIELSKQVLHAVFHDQRDVNVHLLLLTYATGVDVIDINTMQVFFSKRDLGEHIYLSQFLTSTNKSLPNIAVVSESVEIGGSLVVIYSLETHKYVHFLFEIVSLILSTF